MGEPTTAQDYLDAIACVMEDLGTTRQVRIVTYGSLDVNNPGAGKPQSTTDYNVESLIYDYEDKYVDGATVQHGDRVAVIDIDPLETSVISLIKSDAKLVDGSTIYTILNVMSVEVAGEKVTIMLHLRE